jgi:hypothetical protein
VVGESAATISSAGGLASMIFSQSLSTASMAISPMYFFGLFIVSTCDSGCP